MWTSMLVQTPACQDLGRYRYWTKWKHKYKIVKKIEKDNKVTFERMLIIDEMNQKDDSRTGY
jgi:predicted transcriptional regulator